MCEGLTNRKPSSRYFFELFSLSRELGPPSFPHGPLDSTASSGPRMHIGSGGGVELGKMEILRRQWDVLLYMLDYSIMT